MMVAYIRCLGCSEVIERINTTCPFCGKDPRANLAAQREQENELFARWEQQQEFELRERERIRERKKGDR